MGIYGDLYGQPAGMDCGLYSAVAVLPNPDTQSGTLVFEEKIVTEKTEKWYNQGMISITSGKLGTI